MDNILKIVASADEYCTYMSLIEITYDMEKLKGEKAVIGAVIDAAYEYCKNTDKEPGCDGSYDFCWADIDEIPDEILNKYGIKSVYSTLHPLQVDMCECIAKPR